MAAAVQISKPSKWTPTRKGLILPKVYIPMYKHYMWTKVKGCSSETEKHNMRSAVYLQFFK